MEIPLWLALTTLQLLLLATGFVVFLPTEPFVRASDVRRLAPKYAPYFALLVVVLLLHFIVLTLDAWGARLVGTDFADAFAQVEGTLGPDIAATLPAWLVHTFAIDYLFIQPFMLYFAPILFVLMDDERAARASLLGLPIAYLLSAAFFVFLPTTAVYVHFAGFTSPLFTVWPDLTRAYLSVTSANDGFPAFGVAAALVLANAARYSRNRNFRYFAFAHAIILATASVTLGLHWGFSVAGGFLVAVVASTFTARLIDVERLVLQRVKPLPAAAQAVQDAAESLVRETNTTAAALGFEGEAILVGSVAKDTYLAESVDIDVFFAFPLDVSRADLEHHGLALGKSILPQHEIKFAEHPYVHGKFQGFDADLVPCYAVAHPSERMSAVDRTPFHTALVRTRLERAQRDEVRLLKQFLSGIGVYGADARVQGFSGYLAELLVLKYKSFARALEAARGWKPGTYLTLDPVEKPPAFLDALVFIDPVDEGRNVASAVSAESLALFAEASRTYVKRPALRFFFPRDLIPRSPKELARMLAKRRGTVILLSFEPPTILEDHVYNQIRKATTALVASLNRRGFEAKYATYDAGGADRPARILIEVAREELPDTVVHAGPPANGEMHAERFTKTWTGNPDARSEVYVKDGRLFVERRREHRSPDSAIAADMPKLDLGRQLGESLRATRTILVGRDAITEETAELLTRHFDRRRAWER